MTKTVLIIGNPNTGNESLIDRSTKHLWSGVHTRATAAWSLAHFIVTKIGKAWAFLGNLRPFVELSSFHHKFVPVKQFGSMRDTQKANLRDRHLGIALLSMASPGRLFVG